MGFPRSEQKGVDKAAVVANHPSRDFVDQYYSFEREIGRGSFGKVNLVRDNTTGDKRVCKVINTSGMASEVLTLMKKELQLLCQLDHPNIVKLYEYSKDPCKNEIVLVMEYLEGGDALHLLRFHNSFLEEQVVAKWIRQVLHALSYCHALGVLHRDIKPENMMITGKSSGNDMDCKLIDFGFATQDVTLKKEFLGTPTYMAPETVRKNGGYGPETDMWSVGVTALELLSGINPFSPEEPRTSKKVVFEQVKAFKCFRDLAMKVDKSVAWNNRSEEAMEFIAQILVDDPDSRPGAAEALEHPWMEEEGGKYTGVTRDMVRSWVSYSAAPPLARYCLYIVAARMPIPDLQYFGTAFLNMDIDNDGRLSRRELAEGINGTGGLLWGPAVDVDALFQAADLGCTGEITFTEFVAACLCTSYSSLDDLIPRAFDALDDNRDGLVNVRNIHAIFGQCQFPLIHRLPTDRDFTLEEWCKIFTGRRPSVEKLMKPPAPVKPAGAGSLFDRILDHFSCAPCTRINAPDYIVAPTQRITTRRNTRKSSRKFTVEFNLEETGSFSRGTTKSIACM